MIVHFEDKDYTLDLDELDLSEARYIKKHTGLTPGQLRASLGELDPDCMAALYWLMLKQSGQVTDINKLNFPVLKFAAALFAEDEDDKEAEENPTQAEVEPATT